MSRIAAAAAAAAGGLGGTAAGGAPAPAHQLTNFQVPPLLCAPSHTPPKRLSTTIFSKSVHRQKARKEPGTNQTGAKGLFYTRSLGALRAPTSSLWPFGPP